MPPSFQQSFGQQRPAATYQQRAEFQEPWVNPQPGAYYHKRMRYTPSERVELKYTVNDAITAAGTIFKERAKAKTASLDASSVSRYRLDRPITLVEMNDMTDSILQDSATWSDPRYSRQ